MFKGLDWKKIKIGEIIRSISENKTVNDQPVVLINTSDIYAGKVLNHEKIKNENLKGQFKKSFKRNDILFSEIRPINRRNALIDFDSSNYIASTKLMVLRPKHSDLDVIYFYYLLTSKSTLGYLQAMAESRSGTFPQITFKTLSEIEIYLPEIGEQERIVNILSSFDNKIEINNAIIANLDEQTQAIFKSWFVDFEPFQDKEFKESEIGLIPNSFTVKSLKEISTRRNGYTYKSVELHEESNMNMITLKNFNRNGGINFGNAKPIVETERMKGFHFLNNGDILIACTDLTQNAEVLGRTLSYFKNEDYDLEIYSMDLVKIEPNDINDQTYIYYYLNSAIFKSFAEGVATGTTVLHLPKRPIDEFKMLYPTRKVINEFNNIVKPMLLKQNQLILQNKKLKELQETLLPKLMSGEIQVEEAVENE